ncbi:hypothetical protein EC968_008541 [Mortierella alpina]|nr:hypothetical protein EC968_008541 [Mortierella alpina]
MKAEQPEFWSPSLSSSASSTSSLSGEEADVEDLPPYDSDELQYPSSEDSDLKTDASDDCAETSSHDPFSPSPPSPRPPQATDTVPGHHKTGSSSSIDPDMDFCVVQWRVHHKQESLDEQVVPSSSATQHIDQTSSLPPAITTRSDEVMTTRSQDVRGQSNPDQVQAVAGEQRASPTLLLPSLLDYDAVLTSSSSTTPSTATTFSSSAAKEATRLEHLQSHPTSNPTEKKEPPFSRNKRRFAQEPQFFLLAVLSAIGVIVLLLILGWAWLLRSARSTHFHHHHPSHAFVRHVDYAYDSLTGIVHIDLYTSQGTPFVSKRVHPFHVRVDLAGQVNPNWTPQATQMTGSSSDAGAPLVHDLGNGTYKLHLHRPPQEGLYQQQKKHSEHQRNQFQHHGRSHRRRRAPAPAPAPAQGFRSWLCPEVSQYHLYLWFENGTRVPDTPLRLEWSTMVPLPGKESLRTGTSTTPPPTQHDPHQHHYHQEDDQEQDDVGIWTNGLQPVLCELHRISNAVMSFTFLISNVVLRLISHSLDRWLGVELDFVVSTHPVTQWIRTQHNSKKHLISKVKKSLFGHYAKGSPDSHHHHHPGASDKKKEEEPTDLMVLFDQQVKSLTRAVVRVNPFAAGIQRQLPTPEKILETADRILVRVEDRVVKLIQYKHLPKRISKCLPVHEIVQTVDRVFFRTEQELERLIKIEFVQHVNQRVKRKVVEFQATSQGEWWCHRLQSLREGVSRRWTRFQSSLSQDD